MQRFATDQTPWAWLRKQPVRVGCLSFIAVLSIGGVIWALRSPFPWVSLGPLAFAALTLGGVSFLYFTSRSVAVLDGSLLYLPAPIFDGTFFPRRREGYVYRPTGSVVFVAVDVDNIRAVWRATDVEVERLSQHRGVPQDSIWVGSGMLRVDPFQIQRAMQAHGDRPGDGMRQMIEDTFSNRLVHDPARAVGVRIKQLAPARFGPFGGRLVNRYPTFEDVAVYVSVKDPDALVDAVRSAAGLPSPAQTAKED